MPRTREKPAQIAQEDWDAVTVPEADTSDFSRAKPFAATFPDHFASWTRGPGRPPSARPKVHVGFRLAADVVDGIKATGKGYNARVEKVLRAALADGTL